MNRSNIEKIANTPEDKVLLARIWDKINGGIQKNIPASTRFLTPREQELTRYLFGNYPGLIAFGGYPDAERKTLCYLPEYLEETSLYEEDAPIVCLRATFYQGDTPSHRDFLGALLGAGISRDAIGDISVGKGSCDFFVTAEEQRQVDRSAQNTDGQPGNVYSVVDQHGYTTHTAAVKAGRL